MQPRAVRGITDIHPRTFADRFQTFEDLDAGLAIRRCFDPCGLISLHSLVVFHVKLFRLFQDSDAHGHDHILEAVISWHSGYQRTRIGIVETPLNFIDMNAIQHVEQIANIETHINGIAHVLDLKFFLCLFLLGICSYQLSNYHRPNTTRTPLNFSLVRIAARFIALQSVTVGPP
jgi:hypothetical protein